MYLLGHFILGYAVAKLAVVSRGACDLAKKGTRGASFAMPPVLLLYALVFSNWPDFLHAGGLRTWTHNLVAVLLVTPLVLLVMHRMGLIDPFQAAVLFMVSLSHAAGDMMVGFFLPFWPFSGLEVGWLPFAGQEEMFFDAVGGFAALASVLFSGEHLAMPGFLASWTDAKGLDRLARFMHPAAFFCMSVFSCGQLLLMGMTRQSDGVVSVLDILAFIAFCAFNGLLGMIFAHFIFMIFSKTQSGATA